MPGPAGGKRRRTAPPPAAAAPAPAPAPAAAAPLKSLGLQLRKDSSLICYIFLKAHQPAHESSGGAAAAAPDHVQAAMQQQQHRNAVFVAGLPLGLEDDDLAAVFSCFGEVAQVVLHTTKVCFGGAVAAAAVSSLKTVCLQPLAPVYTQQCKHTLTHNTLHRPAALWRRCVRGGQRRLRGAGSGRQRPGH